MSKEKPITEITVSTHPEYCVWKIATENLAFDAVVNVGPGCQAVLIKNGRLAGSSTGRFVINPKSERKENNKIELLGVNLENTFEVLCGVGGIPYKDPSDEFETVTSVGVSTSCKARVLAPWTLYTMLGNHDIKPREISEYLREKCAEILRCELSKKLQSFTYYNITTQQTTLSDTIKSQFMDSFSAIGVQLVSDTFALGEIFFPAEYKETRQLHAEQQADDRRQEELGRREAKVRRSELEELRIISELGAAAATETKTVKNCSNCGMTVQEGTLFCPKCGKKL